MEPNSTETPFLIYLLPAKDVMLTGMEEKNPSLLYLIP